MELPLNGELPPIPKIRDVELRNAVSALTQSAAYYREVVVLILQGQAPKDVLIEHLELLQAADAIITKWLDEFREMDFDNRDIDPIQN